MKYKYAHADGSEAKEPPSLIIDGMRVHGPLTSEQLAKVGIYPTLYLDPGPEYIVVGYKPRGIENGLAVYDAEAVLAADQAAVELQTKAHYYGGFVARLAHHVSVLGHDIATTTFAAIMSDVVARSAAGTLSAEQQISKGDAIDLYGILSRTLSDDEIQAIWAAVIPKEDEA